MSETCETCLCGNKPRFACHQIAEDTVVSSYGCAVLDPAKRIGCGLMGPEIEDAYADRPTALSAWNAMIRNTRKETQQ